MICHDMVEEHKLVYIMSGRFTLKMGNRRVTLNNGEAIFVGRNHLVKEFKQTGANGEPFKGLFLHLHVSVLKKIASKIDVPEVKADNKLSQAISISLPSHPFLKGLFLSLDEYFTFGKDMPEELIDAKIYETVLILLKLKPELSNILFDFRNEWKVDLKGFMEKNYQSDFNIKQFAYFTGRSLSTFKRDFNETFGETPHRWIMHKRLDKAYFLLTGGQCIPSQVYLEAGFKNPNHFITAFKRRFGMTPTEASMLDISK